MKKIPTPRESSLTLRTLPTALLRAAQDQSVICHFAVAMVVTRHQPDALFIVYSFAYVIEQGMLVHFFHVILNM
jgi:hypothetical protein